MTANNEETRRLWREIARQIAVETGDLVMKYYGAEVAIHVKDVETGDLVTEADFAAESNIREALHALLPNHKMLAEEAYRPGDLIEPGEYTWIVDPIDGTSNFAHRLPLFSISMGLYHSGRPQVGVIHAPAVGWHFSAAAGLGGAYHEIPLRVSERRTIKEAIIACDWSRSPQLRHLSLATFETVGRDAHSLRSMGSAALGFAAVAAGWIDIYFNYSLQPWDVAAGILLVEEAGGLITRLDGSPFTIGGGAVLVTNGLLHEEALKRIAPHLSG